MTINENIMKKDNLFTERKPYINESVPVRPQLSDQPPIDTTLYGPGPNDSINDTTEDVVVTQHSITINKEIIQYAAHTGHLVVYDQKSARPSAKIFYISFTKNDVAASGRPVTFFITGAQDHLRYTYYWDHLDHDT